MTRRKEPAPLLPEDEEEVEISEKMATVMDVLDRLGDKAEAVMLNSYDRETKKHAYMATIPVEQFSVDYVSAEYGGGDYIALMLDERGKIVGRSVFQVDRRFKGKRWGDAAPATAAHPGMDPNTALVLGQMKGMELVIQSQGAMVAGLLQALTGKKNEGGDALDVGLRIAEMMKGAGAGSGGSPSVKELVSDMAETFREGIKFGQMTQTPPEKGFSDVIESLIPPVTKVLESYAKGPAAALPAGTPPKPSGAKGAGPAVDLAKAPWLIHLRPFMQEIGQWAQAGWDPEAYVSSMLARMPDNLVDEIEVAARDPQFVTNALAALPPQFHAFQGWLTKALESLKEQVQPEPGGPQLHEDEEDDDGPTG